jgi:hypothetical protein
LDREAIQDRKPDLSSFGFRVEDGQLETRNS